MEPTLAVISSQASQMRKCLETPGRLMASLKHATLMLAELRQEAPPKVYYSRYMACFDALSQLAAYLKDVHESHHLADIYENVQYATFAVPRIYLMITVGSSFMSVPDAPCTDVLQDMLDMCRGIQNPLKGLFVRYYLAQRVREYLPQLENVNDVVKFVMTNFIEMNKLWVRMQHVGPSTEREKRAAERKDLQTIVGFNVEQLAYLNIPLLHFSDTVFPALLQQIIYCRDPLAQEYLLDVICSAFPAEFHLGTLDAYLDSLKLLSPSTNLPKVLLQSIHRLDEYYVNEMGGEAGEADPKLEIKGDASEPNGSEAKESKDEPVEPAEIESNESRESQAGAESESKDTEDSKDVSGDPKVESSQPKESDELVAPTPETKPEPTELQNNDTKAETNTQLDIKSTFTCYRTHLGSLEPRLNHGQRAEIVTGLARFAYALDPTDLDRIHELLIFVEGENSVPNSNIVELLLDLLDYMPLLDLIGFGTFRRLVATQSREGQQMVAKKVLEVILNNSTAISEYSVAKQIFDLFGLITKGGNMSALHLSELVYLLQTSDPDQGTKLLQLAHESLRQGGVNVVQHTYGALVTSAVKIVRENPGYDFITLFKFIGSIINDVATIGSQPEKAFRLYVFVAGVADQASSPEACYEYFVQAFSLYEEHISDSRAQYQAILILTGALQKTRSLDEENYDTIASRCAQYGQKLLKKADQCRAIYMTSHLWYLEDENGVHFTNEAKVLDTLQRALRVADASMDSAVTVELFVEVLNRFLYFLERDASGVTEKHVNGLIQLIETNLKNSDEATSESPRKYFERTLEFIELERANISSFSDLVSNWSI